jgi:cytochrome c oxidase cbb3-type subunit 3
VTRLHNMRVSRGSPAATAMLLLCCASSAAAQQAVPPAVRYDQHVAVGGNPPPAMVPRNPFRGDSGVAAQGGRLFSGFNCDGCHGGGAAGFVGPSLADGRWRYGGDDGAIFMSIFFGRPKGMPAFGGTLPAESIWRLVTYLQSFQPPDSTISTTRW